MLTHPTLDALRSLRMPGMAQALEEQLQMPDIHTLAFEERLGLLVDRECTHRDTRRLKTRLRKATLRHTTATIEDIDYRYPHGLDKALITKLATTQWLREHANLLIIGPTGMGKSWLACALAHKACRDGYSARYAPKTLSRTHHRQDRWTASKTHARHRQNRSPHP